VWDAARAAAAAAVRDAAGVAATAAVWDAARVAAGVAATAAVWDAARVAAGAAVWDAQVAQLIKMIEGLAGITPL